MKFLNGFTGFFNSEGFGELVAVGLVVVTVIIVLAVACNIFVDSQIKKGKV